MEIITPQKITAVQTLLSKCNLREEKAIIVDNYTVGRTTSVKEMYDVEANALLSYLQEISPTKASEDRMKKKILSMAHELGWKIDGKIDMSRVNNWCRKYGAFNKPLDHHTAPQLRMLVTAFTKMYNSVIKKL